MSQSSTSRSFVHPFAPWYVRTRPLIIASLALVMVGVVLALPRAAPAAPAAQPEGTLLYAIFGKTLAIHDLETGARIRTVYDNSNDPFNALTSVITGPDGNVYLAALEFDEDISAYRARILRFDGRSGALLNVFAESSELFTRIESMAASTDGYLYVQNVNQILRYRLSDGAYLGVLVDNLGASYPSPGIPPTLSITQIEIGPDDQLYALSGNDLNPEGLTRLLVKYNRTTGAFLNTVLGPGNRINRSFALGPDGTIYGSEYLNESDPLSPPTEIFRYSPDGQYLGILTNSARGADYLRFGPDGQLYARVTNGIDAPGPNDILRRFDPQTGVILGEYALNIVDGIPSGKPQTFTFVGQELAETGGPVRQAAVNLSQRAAPALQAARGELITLTLAATNRGDGSATDATIDLPLDPARVQLLDAQFSRPEAWVSARREGGVTIQTGRLGSNGDTVTATLRLLVRADAPDGPLFPSRPTLRWRDVATGGNSTANLVPVVAAGQSLDSPTLPLAIDPPTAAPGVARGVSAAWLTPGEPVALWYNRPDGSAVAVGRVTATADGALSYQLATVDLAPGSYSLVAQGVSSGVILAGPFEVGE